MATSYLQLCRQETKALGLSYQRRGTVLDSQRLGFLVWVGLCFNQRSVHKMHLYILLLFKPQEMNLVSLASAQPWPVLCWYGLSWHGSKVPYTLLCGTWQCPRPPPRHTHTHTFMIQTHHTQSCILHSDPLSYFRKCLRHFLTNEHHASCLWSSEKPCQQKDL